MNEFKRIVKAEMFNILNSLRWMAFFMVLFYIYFKLVLGLSLNIAFYAVYILAILIYKMAMADRFQISKYLSMNCTRKNVFTVIWIRWGIMLLIFAAVMIAGTMFSKNMVFTMTAVWSLISSFLVVVGLGTISGVVAYYSNKFGIVAGIVFGLLVGVGTFILMEISEESEMITNLGNFFNDTTIAISMIVGIVVAAIGFVAQKKQLVNYTVK